MKDRVLEMINANEMINAIAQRIYDKKGFNIIAIDVREITSMTDYFVIAEGSVERHVQALSREIVALMGENQFSIYHMEGEQAGDWIAMDGGSIMIHLMIPDLREKYSLEEVWHEGKVVPLELKLDRDINKEM